MGLFEPRIYHYDTGLVWTGEKKGVLSAEGKHEIEVACPPEFGGHEGIWSPEDLLVAAANLCLLTTFLSYAKPPKRLDLVRYASSARGTVTTVEGEFRFSEIVIDVKMAVKNSDEAEKARKLLDKSERMCLISSSVKADIVVKAEIEVES